MIKKAGRPKGSKNIIAKKNQPTQEKTNIKKNIESQDSNIQKPESDVNKRLSPVRDEKGRLLPGTPKLAGDKVRGKSWKASFLEAITAEKAEQILQDFVKLATDGRAAVQGDVEIILFAMDRLYPKTGQRRYINLSHLKKHNLDNLNGVNAAITDVVGEMFEEKLAIEDSNDVIDILNKKRDSNLQELQSQVDLFKAHKEYER